MTVPLSAETTAGSAAAREVFLGIRPQDLALGSGSSGSCAFEARVDVLEPMGSEVYLYLDSPWGDLVARVEGSCSAREGDNVQMTVPPDRVHLFDGATERSLLRRSISCRSLVAGPRGERRAARRRARLAPSRWSSGTPTAPRSAPRWRRRSKRWNEGDRGKDPRIKLLAVPYDAFPDKISAAIPRGHGPDLFIFAHDRVGDWAEAKVIEPIEFWMTEKHADMFIFKAIDALCYKDSLYGLPMAFKSTALYYNKALVPSAPRSTKELLALGRKLTNVQAGNYGLVYDNVKLYFHAPWLFGFGGKVFDAKGAVADRLAPGPPRRWPSPRRWAKRAGSCRRSPPPP